MPYPASREDESTLYGGVPFRGALGEFTDEEFSRGGRWLSFDEHGQKAMDAAVASGATVAEVCTVGCQVTVDLSKMTGTGFHCKPWQRDRAVERPLRKLLVHSPRNGGDVSDWQWFLPSGTHGYWSGVQQKHRYFLYASSLAMAYNKMVSHTRLACAQTDWEAAATDNYYTPSRHTIRTYSTHMLHMYTLNTYCTLNTVLHTCYTCTHYTHTAHCTQFQESPGRRVVTSYAILVFLLKSTFSCFPGGTEPLLPQRGHVPLPS
jgi:hypothetical protein